ncbi:MAG TPA: SEC-C metal-binding domain-containing protein [Candidatus Sulfotelmatobacter sp.]|nr:SEC-C metal-binding domain-containing protein [Candidatus Sulfotelmatobacter sp.]
MPLQHPLVSRAIEQAQVKVEGYNFDIRKHLVEYDDVLNKQREIIYSRRQEILKSEEKGLKEEILEKIQNSISATVSLYAENYGELSPTEQIIEKFATIVPFDENSLKQISTQLEQIKSQEEKISFLNNIALNIYEEREKQMGKELARQVEKYVTLSVIDNLWVDHLDAVENLRQGIGLRGYGQKDPLVEYKNEAFRMFEQLINGIDDEIIHRIYKIQVQEPPEVHAQHVINQPAGGILGADEISVNAKKPVSSPPKNDKKKLGRNDPCWCGSGKKYKKCHYPN